MVLTSVELSIVYTLAYSAQFQFPLTKKEILERLIFRLSENVQLLSTRQPTIDTELSHLEQLGIVAQENSYYFLQGFESTVRTRQQRAAYNEVKTSEVRDFLDSIRSCSWIKAIFVTGSAAVKNAEADADIDFMIVTAPGRLWLTRLWVIWQAWRRGKRRSWQGEEKRSWCFNLWLEVDQLGLFHEYQSLYTAYELIQAQPVLDRDETAIHLLTDNLWAATFVPLASVWKKAQIAGISQHESLSWWSPLTGLNFLAYLAQRWYMNPHMTRERVELGAAFFHPRNTQQWIFKRWQAVLITVGDALK